MPKMYHVPAKPKDDNGHLELIARIIFVIGFNYTVVEQRWPDIRKAFSGFDIKNVVHADVEKLLKAPGMIKNRRKIETIIHNAKECERIIEEHGSMKKWVSGVAEEHVNNPLFSTSLEEECQRRFKGIGTTTRTWIAYVFKDGKPKPEMKRARKN